MRPSWADFHETHEHSAAIHADLQYQAAQKFENK